MFVWVIPTRASLPADESQLASQRWYRPIISTLFTRWLVGEQALATISNTRAKVRASSAKSCRLWRA